MTITTTAAGLEPAAAQHETPLGSAFGFLQRVGKALMLPVAVLPVAGLLLGIGAAGFSWIPPVVSELRSGSRMATVPTD